MSLLEAKQKKKRTRGTSLVVQWLRLCACTAGGTGFILVKELRSHMLCGAAKINNFFFKRTTE